MNMAALCSDHNEARGDGKKHALDELCKNGKQCVMMESDVHALRSEFNRNQSSCALKSCGRAQTITWNGSESRWPAAADS